MLTLCSHTEPAHPGGQLSLLLKVLQHLGPALSSLQNSRAFFSRAQLAWTAWVSTHQRSLPSSNPASVLFAIPGSPQGCSLCNSVRTRRCPALPAFGSCSETKPGQISTSRNIKIAVIFLYRLMSQLTFAKWHRRIRQNLAPNFHHRVGGENQNQGSIPSPQPASTAREVPLICSCPAGYKLPNSATKLSI